MNDLDKAVGFHVRELSNAIKNHRQRDEEGTEIGQITIMQRWIIGYLTHNQDHDVFQRELEQKLNISKSTLTEVLNTMEKNDLVQRVSAKQDARCKKIVLTEKSICVNSIICEKIQAAEDKLRKDISEEEIEMFLKIIKKMIANISED